MKSKLSFLAALVFGALLLAFTVGAGSADHAVFEYQITHYENRNLENALNEDGQKGWELIAVTGEPDRLPTFYLKRRIR